MTRIHTPTVILYAVAACTAYFGAAYLLRAFVGAGWAAAYHQRLGGGVAYEQLGDVGGSYATLVGVIGCLFLGMSITNVVLARALAAAPDAAVAWRALLALDGTGLALLTATNLRNGLASPWWLNAILLVGVGVALLQTRPARVA